MISSVRPLYAGNALQVTLAPPAGATAWRLLRKAADTFTGIDDADALVAFDGTDPIITDAEPGLINEVPAYYKPYYLVAGAWQAGATISGTPLATYDDRSTDVMRLVRNRLADGLKVEVARGTFALENADSIMVLTSPPTEEKASFPLVTLEMQLERARDRGVGELVDIDSFDTESGMWVEHEGWLADVRLEISGWSLNPDERIELRKAIRRVLVANLGVFAAAGMNELELELSDRNAVNGEFGAPVFMVTGSLSCTAPVVITNKVSPIGATELVFSAEVPAH